MKLFYYMMKKSTQKLKYLENEKSFRVEIKWLSLAKRCFRPESASLRLSDASYLEN